MRSNQITNNIFVHVIITRIGHLNFTRNNHFRSTLYRSQSQSESAYQ